MPSFRLAHVKENGIDVIIIPMDHTFHNKPEQEKDQITGELQLRAEGAGLPGTVVLVWEHSGKMYFIAPDNWHPFIKTLQYRNVLTSLNKTLSW
jgi:hypothetical protein